MRSHSCDASLYLFPYIADVVKKTLYICVERHLSGDTDVCFENVPVSP